MNELLVGYARVSTEQQDLTSQRNGLHALGVGDDRIYVDHGLTGANRDRPGLRLALAACRAGDTLVVTKLDRLARSLPDARDILDELTKRNVKLSLGGSIYDPTDPVGWLLFNVLAMVAEFESDLIRLRTREGMKVAKAKGRLRGKQPKLKPNQAKHLLELHDSGNYTQSELAELFGVGRSTIYRTIERIRPKPPEPERPFAHLARHGSNSGYRPTPSYTPRSPIVMSWPTRRCRRSSTTRRWELSSPAGGLATAYPRAMPMPRTERPDRRSALPGHSLPWATADSRTAARASVRSASRTECGPSALATGSP
jgi:DNA invertase Pin-like site-specific DNA recombinase